MKDLPRVTLVAVTSIKIKETIRAMRKSMRGIRFAEAILLTDQPVDGSRYGINVITIQKLDYKGYSHFILYELKDYIKTDFALVVQYDGYVIRPKKWRDEFLNYDYIGAPWSRGEHFSKDGSNVRVGNGGFSLRSRKLLEAPSKLNLPFTDDGTGYFNEDGNICVYHRKILEQDGVSFAPVSIASTFSREKKCGDSYRTPFGFHGKERGVVRSVRRFLNKLYKKTAHKSKDLTRGVRRDMSSFKNLLMSGVSLAEYRRGHKIYDIFTFFNELDLLEMRLNILDPYVDYFVIIEATETFSGLSKHLCYEENKGRFKKWESKIIHYVIRDTPKNRAELQERLNREVGPDSVNRQVMEDVLSRNTIGNKGVDWTKELYQKESIKKALVGLSDEDICFVSDVDEIWDPHAKIDYSKDAVFKLRQKMYAYYLNNRSSEAWIGPVVTRYKTIKSSYLNDLRSEKKTRYEYISNGGWHFTNMGGADQIRKKLESYGHQEYNNDTIKSNIEEMMAANKDFIGRKFKFWTDESELPQYLLDNRTTYAHLFRPKP